MQASLFPDVQLAPVATCESCDEFHAELREFDEFGASTQCENWEYDGGQVAVYQNEFWTSKQRACHSLHEVSYRACFKPQVPRFFIERLTAPGDAVFDPFMGRGTTPIEAALLGRRALGSDLNPVAQTLATARVSPPNFRAIEARLNEIELPIEPLHNEELLVFFERATLGELEAWQRYLGARHLTSDFDSVDGWIEMVAANRLTGHSPGFFSVYTMPPNQAVSLQSQRKINEKREQTPTYRDTRKLIARKSRQLLRDEICDCDLDLDHRIWTGAADSVDLPDDSIDLIVTSPPFLDIVDYKLDNWLRAWFCGHDLNPIPLWQTRDLGQWRVWMTNAFREWHRILEPGGALCFEVGEVSAKKVRLEIEAVQIAAAVGFKVECIVINNQNFTKTAHLWGVTNGARGTNSNRVVVLRK